MTSREPLVTILMNCYNGERYLREALDSVLAQTYRNWEVVFWDNKSTDGSAAICRSYDDPRIKYFYANEHTNMGGARLLAFEKARGEYVAILDVDDIASPERIERQVDYLGSHPEVSLIGSWAHYIDEHGKVFAEFKPTSDRDELRECLGWTDPIVHSSTMYRRRLAEEVGGYPKDLVYASDYGLMLKLAECSEIAVIDEFLCRYRIVSTSATCSEDFRIDVAREILSMFQQVGTLRSLSSRGRRLNRRTCAIMRIKLGITMLRSGQRSSGLAMMLRGLTSDPSVLWNNRHVCKYLGLKTKHYPQYNEL